MCGGGGGECQESKASLGYSDTYWESITIPVLKKFPHLSDLPSGCISLRPHGTFYTGFQHAEVTPTLQMGKQRLNSKAWNCTLAPN